jgi:hypothetical protein
MSSPHRPQSHATTIRHADRPLNRSLVRQRHNCLRLILLRVYRPRLPWLRRLSLQEHRARSLFLRLPLLSCVLLHTNEKLFTRARVAHMLDADVDALFHVAVADLLVEDDTNGGFGYVVDDAGFAVIDFVGLYVC